MKKIWTWFASFFSKESKDRIAKVIDEVQNFVEQAMPIVILIDEKLKPALENSAKLKAVYQFLKEYSDNVDDLLAVAEKLARLPTPDMLANIAILLLQNKNTIVASLSTLKLAIELAYSIYKSTKNENPTPTPSDVVGGANLKN